MFAFAIWDAEKRELFAARDRLGIKPFYYRPLAGGGLAFASEIKALLELGRPEVDPTALRDYFTYKCAPAPKTIYSGISQLPPAHRLLWRGDGSLAVTRYWSPSPEADHHRRRRGRRAPRRAALRGGARAHGLADVPVGVFLSGGIDSSTLVAYLDRPRTFTLGSDIEGRDESELARRLAEHFGAEHHQELGAAIVFEDALEAMPGIFDEPFGDSGAWAVYLVARLARRHVKVALSGEGGDELFCGYDKYSKWFTDRAGWLGKAAGAVAAAAHLGAAARWSGAPSTGWSATRPTCRRSRYGRNGRCCTPTCWTRTTTTCGSCGPSGARTSNRCGGCSGPTCSPTCRPTC